MGGGGVVGWVAGWGSVVVVWVGFVGELLQLILNPKSETKKSQHILKHFRCGKNYLLYRCTGTGTCICKFTKEITYS